MSSNIKKQPPIVNTATKKAPAPRYHPPPPPAIQQPPNQNQHLTHGQFIGGLHHSQHHPSAAGLQVQDAHKHGPVVAVGDSGHRFQTIAEVDRHQPIDKQPLSGPPQPPSAGAVGELKHRAAIPPQYHAPPAVLPSQTVQPGTGLPLTSCSATNSNTTSSINSGNPAEMLKFVRKPPPDHTDAQRLAEQTRRMASELRTLKEANQRLSDDNQELRDLCCFLDDDRQKGRKLAREWQRFGRYTASVMRQEVSAYQAKLRELDTKQHELIKDNLELKELCLYLDEERSGVCRACGAGLRRDDGDGSSSSTNADEPPANPPTHSATHTVHMFSSRPPISSSAIGSDQSLLEYVQHLETRIKNLEEEKRVLQQKLGQGQVTVTPWDHQPPNDSSELGPEAVVQALQVLEVREQLERSVPGSETDLTSTDMADGEKALLREMCNVVWRKLEEGPQTRR